MTHNAQFRKNVRGFYAWIGSMIVMGAAPLVAMNLIGRGTAFGRAAGVAAGVGGMLPWMWVVLSIIRGADEFVRRLHLVALGVAFGGTLVLLVTLAWLAQAELIAPPDLMLVWVGCLLLWFLALMGAKLYFERVA
jgi:hypothetical protein